tara:strand:+ start:334 stop:528 length:195 start_codon:yes stop_codon:yes gene_type:complete
VVDEVDIANKNVEKEIETALKNIDTTIPKNETGKCLACGENITDERRWCNADCRDNYEKTNTNT